MSGHPMHVARRQLGLSEDGYRAVLALNGGVASATELDHHGFTAVMARLEQLLPMRRSRKC